MTIGETTIDGPPPVIRSRKTEDYLAADIPILSQVFFFITEVRDEIKLSS